MSASITIGEKIRKVREFRNYTQEYMAQQLHLSTAGYNKIERGETDLTISRMEAIAKILEVDSSKILNASVEQILNFHDSPYSGSYNHYTVDENILKSLQEQLTTKDKQIAQLMQLLNVK